MQKLLVCTIRDINDCIITLTNVPNQMRLLRKIGIPYLGDSNFIPYLEEN